jgi:hypothetical protein
LILIRVDTENATEEDILKSTLTALVSNAKQEPLKRISNTLGVREFESESFPGKTVNQKLTLFMTRFLDAREFDADKINSLATSLFDETFEMAKKYVRQFVLPAGNVGKKWKQVSGHEDHERIFEWVLFSFKS